MRVDVYAHCVVDGISINGGGGDGKERHLRPGGPGCYCGQAARKLRFDVDLHTRFGPDFERGACLDGCGVSYDAGEALVDVHTTRFRIDVRGAQRDLYLENVCSPVVYGGPPDKAPDCVIINPVFGEVSAGDMRRIVDDSEFTFVDPQGLLRRADDATGRIRLEGTDVDLSGVSAIKASPDELEVLAGDPGLDGMKALQKRGVRYVLRTDGAAVSLLDGDRLYSLRIPDRDIYDTTGIGDIFGTTFACTMIRERDSIWALCFAGGSAQAALETGRVGLEKVPERGATSTNASYFYNMIDFKNV